MRRIAILLPSLFLTSSGGYRVILDYANRLAQKGWRVELVLPIAMLTKGQLIERVLKGIARAIVLAILPAARYPKWYELEKSISIRIVPTLSQCFVPLADVYLATAANTAQYLMHYHDVAYGYFVQGYEDWILPKKDLEETYRSSLAKFSVSRWLADEMKRVREQPVVIVPNGIDLSIFGLDVPLLVRERHSIAVMYHPAAYKRFEKSMQVVVELKRRFPELVVNVFGVYKRPKGLPSWCFYYEKPKKSLLRSIYNSSRVYLAMSSVEGWGLTIGEAMACGCVVCCTDCKGYREMAIPMVNAVVVGVDDVDGMAHEVARVLADDRLADCLSREAVATISRISTDTSFQALEKALSDLAETSP